MHAIAILFSIFVVSYFVTLLVLDITLAGLYRLVVHLNQGSNRGLPAKPVPHLFSREGLQPTQMAVLAASVLHDRLWPQSQPLFFHGLVVAYTITVIDFQWPHVRRLWSSKDST